MTPDFEKQFTAEEMEASVKQWQDWIGGIASQGKFVGTNQLGFEGKTLKPANIITDGPYAEVKEITGGYVIVKTDSLDNAMKLAEGCPILDIGENVEIRDIIKMQ